MNEGMSVYICKRTNACMYTYTRDQCYQMQEEVHVNNERKRGKQVQKKEEEKQISGRKRRKERQNFWDGLVGAREA